ncbi:hypothetical protein [sulfur-oxidizing endosymbiont of Gigantopelta aegis]|uniref:hypothetical protein n=1 Tax=sulfur-oxidizing endosymbiont of Gigantopelta aegis TaxID=2794934 RepID=UPI0018DE8299|nr:hypothetical protein [sulfur-oxidizing endosymbiont of Gigantopelta aegis]
MIAKLSALVEVSKLKIKSVLNPFSNVPIIDPCSGYMAELTAVNLSWDSVYRYRHMPKEYYDD